MENQIHSRAETRASIGSRSPCSEAVRGTGALFVIPALYFGLTFLFHMIGE